jgi:hypothetical protein
MEKSNYEHLTIDCKLDKGEILTKSGFDRSTKYFVLSHIAHSGIFRFSRKLVTRLSQKMNSLYDIVELDNQFKKTLENIQGNAKNANVFGSSYGYKDDLHELRVAMDYQRQIENKETYTSSESGVLYDNAVATLDKLLKADSSIPSVLNFGASYAYVDSICAQRFPNVRFIGIDRSTFTKAFNEAHFKDIKNIEFVADDIFRYLSSNKLDNSIFFHARTLILLPRKFIEELYRAVYDAGFKYIVGFEPIGISRQTSKPYVFSQDDRESVVYRPILMIHNYPGLLKKSGYEIIEANLLKTNHPHKDQRILYYIARKK